jgi:transcriptional regulator with XRE-family HTH domain
MILNNYEKISRSLFKSLRGDLTQKEISQKLGYSFNQWHKFESGQKIIMWSDFYSVVKKINIPIDQTLRIITAQDFKGKDVGGRVVQFIWAKFGEIGEDPVFEYLKMSPSKWRRIMNCEQDVELSIVLNILGDFSALMPFFLESVCKDNMDFEISDIVKKSKEIVKFEAKNPFLCVIEGILVSKEYRNLSRHSDEHLAQMIGVSKEEIRRGLIKLTQVGAVAVENKKYVLQNARVDMEQNIQDSAEFAKYWTQICAQRFETEDGVPLSKRGWSYRVFPISEKASEKIRQKIQNFIGEMNSIIFNDKIEDMDRVQMFMLHYFDHHEIKEIIKKAKKNQI